MRSAVLLSISLLALLAPLGASAQYYQSQHYNTINRATFVQMALNYSGVPLSNSTHCFRDVTNQVFANAVCTAAQYGYITGHPSGNFRPYDAISFVEAAAIAIRAEGVSVRQDPRYWYVPYLQQLAEWDATPRSITNVLHGITPGQAQELLSHTASRRNTSTRTTTRTTTRYSSSDDIEIEIDVDEDNPEPGDRIRYTIRIRNNTSSSITIDVVADLDNDLHFRSASDNGDDRNDEVRWDNVRIPARSTETLSLNVEVDDRVDDGDSLRIDVRADGERLSETIRVDDDGRSRGDDEDIRIEIDDIPDPVRASDILQYRIYLENRENRDVRIDVEATLDGDVRFESANRGGEHSGDTVEWDNIEIDEDEEEMLILRVRVQSDLRDGDTVRLRVEAGDSEETITTAVIRRDYGNRTDDDIDISITDSPREVWRGDELTYYITLENRERYDVRLDVRAFLDSDTAFLSASNGGQLQAGDEVLWRDIRIDSEDEREMVLRVRVRNSVDRGDTIRLRIEAGDDQETEDTEVE